LSLECALARASLLFCWAMQCAPGGRTEIGGWTDLVWMPETAPQVTPEMLPLIIFSDYAFVFVYMKIWMHKGMRKFVQLQSYVFR